MIQRFVTSVDKTVWNGQTQINALIGVDENNQPFTVNTSQASIQIRMKKIPLFLMGW